MKCLYMLHTETRKFNRDEKRRYRAKKKAKEKAKKERYESNIKLCGM